MRDSSQTGIGYAKELWSCLASGSRWWELWSCLASGIEPVSRFSGVRFQRRPGSAASGFSGVSGRADRALSNHLAIQHNLSPDWNHTPRCWYICVKFSAYMLWVGTNIARVKGHNCYRCNKCVLGCGVWRRTVSCDSIMKKKQWNHQINSEPLLVRRKTHTQKSRIAQWLGCLVKDPQIWNSCYSHADHSL